MNKKVTIKDIAAECGVSIGTVDRILHNRGRFSAETAARVQAAVEKLGYTPKHTSENFFQKPTFRIGVNYPYETTPGLFWNDANEGIIQGETALRSMGIEIIRDCTSSFSTRLQKDSIRHLLEMNVDAIITTAFDTSTALAFNQIIPASVPFATVINRSWNSQGLFHIGPYDEGMGAAMAKLISLYCGAHARIAIIAPSIEIEGTNRRIGGFVRKVQEELTTLDIVQIAPVIAEFTDNAYQIIKNETCRILNNFPDLDALYITNGYALPVCDAIKGSPYSDRIKVFAHESFTGIQEYLNDGSLTATIYQNPRQQWYDALLLMANYLLNHTVPEPYIKAGCYVLTRETYPIINF